MRGGLKQSGIFEGIAIVVVANWVLDGHGTSAESSSLTRADSTAGANSASANPSYLPSCRKAFMAGAETMPPM